MSNHPNFDRTLQAVLDAVRQGGDHAPTFDLLAGDVAWENGPGAGPSGTAPWRGQDDLALMLMEFGASLGGTFSPRRPLHLRR